MWKDQSGGNLNLWATKGAFLILWTHALALGLGIYIETGSGMGAVFGAVIFAIGLVLFTQTEFKPSLKKECTKGTCHLQWGFNAWWYLFIVMACIFLAGWYIRPLSKVSLVMCFLLALAVLSLVQLKYYDRQDFTQSFGSLWCWYAAAFGAAVIILNA